MLFSAVKDGDSTAELKFSCPAAESRLSNATSEGELARGGTFGTRAVLESNGNTRYISTVTEEIVGNPPTPGTSSPTNEAPVMLVCDVNAKSSAASISLPAGETGRLAIAIWFVGVRLL